MVYIIFICFAVPLALMLPLLHDQSRRLVAFMLLGAAIAVSSAELNSAIRSILGLSALDVSLKTAPLLEELLKAFPVLLYAIFGSDDQKKVLPLGMSVGIGFAILENTYLLVGNLLSVSLGWALIRGLATSLMHGMCTFIIGCGIIFVRKQKKLFYTGTFGLLAVAVTFHSTFNLLIQSRWNRIGMFLPITVYLAAQLILLRLRKRPAPSSN